MKAIMALEVLKNLPSYNKDNFSKFTQGVSKVNKLLHLQGGILRSGTESVWSLNTDVRFSVIQTTGLW